MATNWRRKLLVGLCCGIILLISFLYFTGIDNLTLAASLPIVSKSSNSVYIAEPNKVEDIQTSLGVWPYVARDRYPRRVNMSVCEPRYGKIGVFVAVDDNVQRAYQAALKTLECYLKSTPYEFFLVHAASDPDVLEHCGQFESKWKCFMCSERLRTVPNRDRSCRMLKKAIKQNESVRVYRDIVNRQVRFRKHCAATLYITRVDWLLLLDADTGVVNPNHCIEEYIDTRANIIMYERAFDWEVAVGNFLVRNSEMGKAFLMKIANGEKYHHFGSDQGPLPLAILNLVVPSAKNEIDICFKLWKEIDPNDGQYIKFFKYNSCCKQIIDIDEQVRDSYFNDENWNDDVDFMIHAWKKNAIDTEWPSPFLNIPDPKKCGMHFDGWNWRPEKRVSIEKLRQQLSDFEKKQQDWFPMPSRELTYLHHPDIGDCWPHCEDYEE